MKQVILIDAKNMCYRAHWTHLNLSSDKHPTSVLYGVLNMLLSMQRKIQAPVIFCWDGMGETWRHKLVKHRKKQYKSNRNKAMTTSRSAIYQQISPLKILLTDMGIWNIEIDNLEADDLIGILATSLKDQYDRVIIYSGDRDFYQLVSDKITVWPTQGKNKGDHLLTEKLLERQWGVKPKDFTKLRSLSGDKSDNISNIIKGIGSKRALAMVLDGVDTSIEKWNSLPQKVKLKYIYKLETVWEEAHQNYQLCKILTEVSDGKLQAKQKKTISWYLQQLETRGAERQTDKCDIKAFRTIIDTLVYFEMDSILERRRNLWAIP